MSASNTTDIEVSVWPQGRFRYFRLANEQIGAPLEALASTARTEPHLERDEIRLGP